MQITKKILGILSLILVSINLCAMNNEGWSLIMNFSYNPPQFVQKVSPQAKLYNTSSMGIVPGGRENPFSLSNPALKSIVWSNLKFNTEYILVIMLNEQRRFFSLNFKKPGLIQRIMGWATLKQEVPKECSISIRIKDKAIEELFRLTEQCPDGVEIKELESLPQWTESAVYD